MPLDVDQLQKPFKKLIQATKAAKKLENPEQVHKLRTNTRRVEAILQALDLPVKNQRPLLKHLKQVRKYAGKVRDMDVLVAKAADVNASEERSCQVRLLSHLGAERQRKADELGRELKESGKSIRGGLKQYLEKTLRLIDGGDGAVRAETRAAARALQLSGELRKITPLGRKNLHRFRIEGKQLRYVLEMAKPQDEGLVKGLREMQDAIGEWHDWEELSRIAREVLDHGRNCGLLRGLQLHADSSFDEALRVGNAFRKRFLGEKVVEASGKLAA